MFSNGSHHPKLLTKLFAALLSTLIAGASLFVAVSTALAATDVPEVKAEAYIVADFVTGRILASKNTDIPHIPASLTKIMSMYVIFDAISAGEISMDDMVEVSELAWATEGSKMYILVGTEVKVEDLIKGVTVMSGNDACVALAEHVAGNVTSFVDRMNHKARELGLTSAHFVDPHGLSDDNQISAEDLVTLVSSYVLVHPEALPYHALKEFAYTAPGESQKAPQFNRNRLLWSYPGTYGLKTGFTTKAGFNMVALCERSGFHIIVVVLGSAKGKSIDAGERERTALVTSLLDWAYGNYSYVEKAAPDTVIDRVRVWKGKGKWVEAIAPYGLGATVEKGNEDKLVYSVILSDTVEAPVQAGQKVGEAVFSIDGEEIGRMDLLAKTTVPKGNFFRVLWDSVVRALSRAFSRQE
ncbi:MAG: D-alanyl-D-alanine carboxypeptidase family protein [Bacillota bacterium]|jgi:D-alanyl-D-alanine carboxypeptidase (penicillin-binding protein 5/6)